MPDTETLLMVPPPQACVACLRGHTKTCFGMEGSFEAHLTFHASLRIPRKRARDSVSYAYETARLFGKGHRLTVYYWVCPECAAAAELPHLSRPGEGKEIEVFRMEDDPPRGG